MSEILKFGVPLATTVATSACAGSFLHEQLINSALPAAVHGVNMERKMVVVAGSLNYDFILKAQRLPQKGETMVAEGVQFCGGGKGANQAVQCAKLGLETYMAGAVGCDYMGNKLLKSLESYNVDVRFVKKDRDSSTGLGFVHALEDGGVFATIVRGANYAVSRADIDQLRPLLQRAGMLLLQLEIPVDIVEYAVKVAGESRCKVLLNAAPATPISEMALSECELLVLNEVEAGFYSGRKIETQEDVRMHVPTFVQRIGTTCIVTLGKNGAVLCEDGEISYYPAYDTVAVETTGAGDSFVGGVAYGVLSGMPLKEAITFAICCSGITITGVGAQPSMPERSAVLPLRERYQQQLAKFV